MSAKIAEGIAKLAVGPLVGIMKKQMFGEPADKFAELARDQKTLGEELKVLLIQQHYEKLTWDAANMITFWTKWMAECLEKAKKGEDQDFQELMTTLRSSSSGIHPQLHSLWAGLTGENGLCNGIGLVGSIHEELFAKLKKEDDPNYTVNNYVQDYDYRLTRAVILLQNALLLSILITNDIDEAKKRQQECLTRIETLQTKAYNSFPPALRLLKAGYNVVNPTYHWWRFLQADDRRYCLYFSKRNSIRLPSDNGRGPCPETEFRFDLGSDPLPGMVTIRSRLGDRPILHYTSTVIFGGTSSGLALHTSGPPSFLGSLSERAVTFKWIPLMETADNMPLVLLITYEGEKGGQYKKENWLSTKWAMNDTGVWQSDYLQW
ncbi:hypothetical protein K474DRAFT_1709104 [Panus rudis PR-1116 ss-1]|nr:hypothetical protein K474DRAFT_1709104 [Panus rudis PR-1116 ss-1]